MILDEFLNSQVRIPLEAKIDMVAIAPATIYLLKELKKGHLMLLLLKIQFKYQISTTNKNILYLTIETGLNQL